MTNRFYGGIPYGPDIKKLRDNFPESDMIFGQEITYQDVASLIQTDPADSRFYGVTTAWRKQVEKESGWFLIPVRGKQKFKVIDESEKLSLANKEDRSGVKKSRRSLIVLKSIDHRQLSNQELPLYNFKLDKLGKVLSIQQLRAPQALPEL